MTKLKKWLVITEAIICCFSISILLLPITIMSLFQIILLISGSIPIESVWASISIIVVTFIGILGFYALINVLMKIFKPNSKDINHKFSLLFISLAMILLLVFLLKVESGFLQVVVFLSVASVIHIIYLGRKYLFYRDSKKS